MSAQRHREYVVKIQYALTYQGPSFVLVLRDSTLQLEFCGRWVFHIVKVCFECIWSHYTPYNVVFWFVHSKFIIFFPHWLNRSSDYSKWYNPPRSKYCLQSGIVKDKEVLMMLRFDMRVNIVLCTHTVIVDVNMCLFNTEHCKLHSSLKHSWWRLFV